MALVGEGPGYRYRTTVHDRDGVGRIATHEHEAAGAVIPRPAVDTDRRSGAADGEIAHQEDIAVGMSADKGMAAALAHVRVFADPVAQEPEAGRGIAAVVEAV